MSTEILTKRTQNFLAQIFEAEWEINKISEIVKDKMIRTPAFAPFPDNAIQFCFEMWYDKIPIPSTYNDSVSSLKFILIKLSSVDVPTSLEMKFNLKLKFSDGTLMKEYVSLTPIPVYNMTPVTCMEQVFSNDYDNSYVPYNFSKLETDKIIVECHFMYFGHLNIPKTHHHEMRYFNNWKKFSKNFSTIYNPSYLSDLTIQIGDKFLQAHKKILITYSPVFRKMMEHDFLESKTNTITITDSDYETFDYFLKFLYSGEVEDKTSDTVKQLYILADKYDVKVLKQECAAILVSTLTVDQACEVLKFIYDYQDELKENAKCFAAAHFSELVTKSEWKELVKSHPQIGYDVLSVLYQPPQEMLANT